MSKAKELASQSPNRFGSFSSSQAPNPIFIQTESQSPNHFGSYSY